MNTPDRMTVFVRGLTLAVGIGVYDHERGRAQPVVVDVELTVEPRLVDRLADTLNYETVVQAARRIADAGHVDLVEQFAQRLGEACLADGRVISARIRVEKPEALAGAAACGCEMVFNRGAV
ncbi:dihydroneopterin aldolase [Brevundimonas sp. 2R-24]|uniref:7,8-dihydroneopterin aldolase n=1 Tax=Peiella sedimenti TaxID=3061083 RepID=A0ABT8SJD8_9CAUL|nr:dihydroneopterin aldolase [Caulobacteraceae bacterium XZ-24]